MTSIKARLIAILIGTTGLVWLSAVIWIYASTQAEVERVLDARLAEAARMVNSLLTDQRIEVGVAPGAAVGAALQVGSNTTSYGRQLSCQIWSLNGALIARSTGAPDVRLTEANQGFSENEINGEIWRVYSIENAELGVSVMIGDSLRVRERLVGDVIKGLLLPASIIFPFLGGLIWLSVRRGLKPLRDMARTLSSRKASDLRPLPTSDMPEEIAPAVDALNLLFKRVDAARERERSFTAFAAHELRTPLAGLKTQAQIALGSADAEVHANALRQIAAGVDRTGRLVKQLLDLASLEASEAEPSPTHENISSLVQIVIAEQQALASRCGVAIRNELSDGKTKAWIEPNFLMLALRNLLENSISHSPDGGTIVCSIAKDGTDVRIMIEDEGPGIPEEELPRATERFFRGRNKTEIGSGLGLAIAQLAIERLGGSLELMNRDPRGLSVSVSILARGAGHAFEPEPPLA